MFLRTPDWNPRARRDDDEDESGWKKYLPQMLGGFQGGGLMGAGLGALSAWLTKRKSK